MIEKRLTIVNLFSTRFRYEVIWIITLNILLNVYVLGKSKHLIGEEYFYHGLKIELVRNQYKSITNSLSITLRYKGNVDMLYQA